MKTALNFPVSWQDYAILAESLFQSEAFICPSIPGQSVELFVCLSPPCQPHSLTNPALSPKLHSSPYSFFSLQCLRTTRLASRTTCKALSSSIVLYITAEFSLSKISNNFLDTVAGPELYASSLSLVGACNMMWLDKILPIRQFSERSFLSFRREYNTAQK